MTPTWIEPATIRFEAYYLTQLCHPVPNVFVIQTLFGVWVFTDKSYCVTQSIFLKVYYKLMCFWNAWPFNSDKLCVLPRRILKEILWLCSPWPSNVYWRFSKPVNFTGLQEEIYFCSWKMFTCRKLTGVETLLQFLFFFNSMRTQRRVLWTVNTAIAFHIPTHTHKLIFYICSEIFTGILEEFSVSAMWICR